MMVYPSREGRIYYLGYKGNGPPVLYLTCASFHNFPEEAFSPLPDGGKI